MMYNQNIITKRRILTMDKHFSKLVVFTLCFMIVAGVIMCFGWVPTAVEYLTGSCSALYNQELLIYICFALIAIPMFIIFIMAFGFVKAFKQDSVFDMKTAKLIKTIADILLGDCIFTELTIILLMSCGEALLAPLFLFVTLIGVTVSFVLYILSNHVEKAAKLKEETEGIL